MLRGAGAPHGPFCTTIDRGCRECLRLKAESEPRPPLRFGLPQAPRPLPEIEPLSTEDIQRLHKEATERLTFPGELDDRSRDETARDAALTALRLIAEIKRLQTMADDAIGELGSFETRAVELSRRVDDMAASIAELRTVVLRKEAERRPTCVADVTIDPSHGVRFDMAGGYWGSIPPLKARALALQIFDTWPREPFSSTPVEIIAAECPKRPGRPCEKNAGGDYCIYCGAFA